MGNPDEGDIQLQSDWLVMRADIACFFRDFDSAEYWHRKAAELTPERPWVGVRRSSNLVTEDRYEEALQEALRANDLHSSFPPAIRQVAATLVLLGRDHEALELLQDASAESQCGYVLLDLANLQSELGDYQAALATYQKTAGLFPLMERPMAHWLAGRRSDTACLCGQVDLAREMAWLASTPFHRSVAESMTEAAPNARRVCLPVPFVRQHHMTCVPATLSAIAAYWQVSVDHLEIADQICYDGTSSYNMPQVG